MISNVGTTVASTSGSYGAACVAGALDARLQALLPQHAERRRPGVPVERDQEPAREEQLPAAGQLLAVDRRRAPSSPAPPPRRSRPRARRPSPRAPRPARRPGPPTARGSVAPPVRTTRAPAARAVAMPGERLGSPGREDDGVAERLGAGHLRHRLGRRRRRAGDGSLPSGAARRATRDPARPRPRPRPPGPPGRRSRTPARSPPQRVGVGRHADDLASVLSGSRPAAVRRAARAAIPSTVVAPSRSSSSATRSAASGRLRLDQQRHAQSDRGRRAQQEATGVPLRCEDDDVGGVEQGPARAHGSGHGSASATRVSPASGADVPTSAAGRAPGSCRGTRVRRRREGGAAAGRQDHGEDQGRASCGAAVRARRLRVTVMPPSSPRPDPLAGEPDPPGRHDGWPTSNPSSAPRDREEWRAWRGAMSAAFGEELAGPYLDEPSPVAELDRSLGLWEGDRIVATSGIYTRVLTVPGAVVPCAGITWVTVAPTHRRRGVLTAIMRRQLTELHERAARAGRRAVVGGAPHLRAVRLRPGDPPRRADRRHRAAAAAAGRRPRHGPGRPGAGRRATAPPPSALHDRLRADGARQPRPRRPLVGPAAARRRAQRQGRGRPRLPAAHRARRRGHRLRRLPGEGRLDRPRRARRHAHRRGGARRDAPGLRRAVAGACSRSTWCARCSAPLASPDDPLLHLLDDARALHRTPVRRALGPAGRRRPRAGRPPLPGADRPGARGPRRVLPVERRPLAAVRASRPAPTAGAPTAIPTWSSASRSCRRPTSAGSRSPRCRRPAGSPRSARARSPWRRRRSAGRSPLVPGRVLTHGGLLQRAGMG